jgi:hypothetical protein
MHTLIVTPGACAPCLGLPHLPDPEGGRRDRVARALATVAGYGGPLADVRIRQALSAARAYAARGAAAAELAAALAEVARAAAEAHGRVVGPVWTIADARRVAAASEEHRAARAVADALGRALDPAGCLHRPAVRWEPAWLTADVLTLARVVGDGQPDLLPILADALQDAGCAEPEVLDHCRGPGPHGPECWVVGSILDHRHG